MSSLALLAASSEYSRHSSPTSIILDNLRTKLLSRNIFSPMNISNKTDSDPKMPYENLTRLLEECAKTFSHALFQELQGWTQSRISEFRSVRQRFADLKSEYGSLQERCSGSGQAIRVNEIVGASDDAPLCDTLDVLSRQYLEATGFKMKAYDFLYTPDTGLSALRDRIDSDMLAYERFAINVRRELSECDSRISESDCKLKNEMIALDNVHQPLHAINLREPSDVEMTKYKDLHVDEIGLCAAKSARCRQDILAQVIYDCIKVNSIIRDGATHYFDETERMCIESARYIQNDSVICSQTPR